MKKLFYVVLAFDAYVVLAILGMVWWRTLHAGEPPFNVSDFYGAHALLGLIGLGALMPLSISVGGDL